MPPLDAPPSEEQVPGRGPVAFEDQRQGDRDMVERWAEAAGVDLEGEAEKARQKLLDVGRRFT